MSTKIHDGEPLKAVSTSPQRPQHQIKRSVSELSSPIKLPRHHSLHQRRERERDRDRDDHSYFSANPVMNLPRGSLNLPRGSLNLPRSSLDLPRSEGVTPGATAGTSRRLDMFLPGAEDAGNYAGACMAQQPPRSKEEQIQAHRRKTASNSAELQTSLADLSAFSNATMRRLDDTYYSVLERLSMLQSTIVAIKDLASMSQEVNETFSVESKGLVGEAESQLKSVDQFDDQQNRIQVLQDRIYAGRDKVQNLSRRVDVVRERVEGWERADNEWQERTRKRLKVLWIIVSAIVFAMMLVFFGARFAPSSTGDVPVATELASGTQGGNPAVGEFAGNQSRSAVDVMTDEVRGALGSRIGGGPTEEGALRALDEL